MLVIPKFRRSLKVCFFIWEQWKPSCLLIFERMYWPLLPPLTALLNHRHNNLNKDHSASLLVQLVFLKTKSKTKQILKITKQKKKQSNYCERRTDIILGDLDTPWYKLNSFYSNFKLIQLQWILYKYIAGNSVHELA